MRRRGWAVALVTTLVAFGAPAAATPVADHPTEVLSTLVTPVDGSVDTGFLTLRVDIELRDGDGLPDELQSGYSDDRTRVAASRLTGADPSRLPVEWTSEHRIRRVSGTSQHGVWRSYREVTRVHAGEFVLTELVAVTDVDHNTLWSVEIEDGARFSVSASDGWRITPASPPVKIVTGEETWVPRAVITTASTGAPVAGWGDEHTITAFAQPPARRTREPGTRSSPSGVWTGARHDLREDTWFLAAYARRGSRGWSLEAMREICPTTKYQANSRYSSLSLGRGGTLTVTGNAFPAPAIHGGSPYVLLQRATGQGAWQNVASAHVRANGRYTLEWRAEAQGNHLLRVRLPGTTSHCGANVGTTLAAVPVTVR